MKVYFVEDQPEGVNTINQWVTRGYGVREGSSPCGVLIYGNGGNHRAYLYDSSAVYALNSIKARRRALWFGNVIAQEGNENGKEE